jgi:hypothetical protein
MKENKELPASEVRKQFERMLYRAYRPFRDEFSVEERVSRNAKRRKEVERNLERTGPDSYLEYLLTYDALQAFTDATKVAENLEEVQLDWTGFDLDNGNEHLTLIPQDDSTYVVANKAGQVLRHKKTNNPFVIGIEDLGDQVQKYTHSSSSQIWPRVRKKLGDNTPESVDEAAFVQELQKEFASYPTNLTLSYFTKEFGQDGMVLYDHYKKIVQK